MKDSLKDLIDHTLGLGTIELIKVTGTDTETVINAVLSMSTADNDKMAPDVIGLRSNMILIPDLLNFKRYSITAGTCV